MDPTMMIPSYFGGFGPPARFRQRKNAVDAKAYDFRAARTNLTNPNNIVESTIHMLMFGLGGGLVVLHSAYYEAGLFIAIALNIVLSTIVGYCTCTLVWSAQKLYGRVQMPTLTYPDIMEAAVLLSPWPKFRKSARCFRYSVEIVLGLHLYGSCCVFLIMISRNLKELVEGDTSLGDGGDPPIQVYILSMMAPCVIICMVTNLKSLAPFAFICILYALAIILVTLWYGFKLTDIPPWERPAFKSTMGVFQFIGVCTFILEPASYALPVENNMDKPKKFHVVILSSMPIFTAAMILVGFVGYWCYGEASLAPITVHFPFEPFPVTLKVFLCLILYVVYAMCFYVAFDIEWFYLKRNHQMSNYWFWERVYRTLHVIAIDLVSYGLPNVTRLMGVLGALCTTPILFFFPGFIELLIDWEHPGMGRYKWRLLKFIGIAFFGFTIFVGGTASNIYGLVYEIQQDKTLRLHNNTDGDYGPDNRGQFVYKDLERPDNTNVTL